MYLGAIVIAEDDKKIGDALRLALLNNTSGYEVLLTNSGKIGIAKIKMRWTPLAIIDYYLPDMDGVEVIRRIKRTSPQTKVLAISGATDRLILEAISGSGADHFLPKPFMLAELMVHVRELLGISFVDE